jgi:hypothetical protein
VPGECAGVAEENDLPHVTMEDDPGVEEETTSRGGSCRVLASAGKAIDDGAQQPYIVNGLHGPVLPGQLSAR